MNECYVLACGPSIKNQDLKQLKGKPCISISNFFVHKEFDNLNIKYHIFGSLHPPITYEMGVAWFKEAESKINKDTIIMVHKNDEGLINNNQLFQGHKVIFWSDNGSFPNTLLNYIDDYISVSQIALQVGVYYSLNNDIKNVIMLGIDHSWVNHINESRHFYEENESVLNRMGYNEWFNHIDDKKSEETEKNNLIKLSDLYMKYFDIAKTLGINVFNGTPNSLVTNLPFKQL